MIAVMLKYRNILFEDNILNFFLDKISGKMNCTTLGGSEATESDQTLWQSLDTLVITEIDPDIRDVNRE